jgi:hypothetical protein
MRINPTPKTTEETIGLFHQPIEQNRLCDAQLTVERRRQAIPRLEHFPTSLGIPSLVTVRQSHVAESQEEQQPRQEEKGQKEQGMGRTIGCGHRIVGIVWWLHMLSGVDIKVMFVARRD